MTNNTSYEWLRPAAHPMLELCCLAAILVLFVAGFSRGSGLALGFPKWDGTMLHVTQQALPIQALDASELFVP